jgi:hypothetical protein
MQFHYALHKERKCKMKCERRGIKSAGEFSKSRRSRTFICGDFRGELDRDNRSPGITMDHLCACVRNYDTDEDRVKETQWSHLYPFRRRLSIRWYAALPAFFLNSLSFVLSIGFPFHLFSFFFRSPALA